MNNGQTTQKFCGILNTGFSMDHHFQDSFKYNSWGIGAAKSKKEIEVIIFISKEPLQEGETMDLEIAFTLYTGKSRFYCFVAQSVLRNTKEISRLQYYHTIIIFSLMVICTIEYFNCLLTEDKNKRTFSLLKRET